MPISGNPNNDKRQIPAAKIKGTKPTPSHPTKPEDWATGLNWSNITGGNNTNGGTNNGNGGTDGGNGGTDESTDESNPIILPPPPPPGTEQPQTQAVTYATKDNPIIIKIVTHENDLPPSRIRRMWPNWNGQHGQESDFIPPTGRQNQIVVEPYNYTSGEFAGTNKSKEVNFYILKNQHIVEKDGEQTIHGVPAMPQIKHPHLKDIKDDILDQASVYYPIDEKLAHIRQYTVVWRYKIYNTYFANQGKLLGYDKDGTPYYEIKTDLAPHIHDIVQLPTPQQNEQPANAQFAYAGMIQQQYTAANKTLNGATNISGAFFCNPTYKVNKDANNAKLNDLPNATHANYLFAETLTYNQNAPKTPQLKTNAYAYFLARAVTTEKTILHSETLTNSDGLFAASTETGDLSNYKYPNIKTKPENYDIYTQGITKTYWD
jgi:hypothetical protein